MPNAKVSKVLDAGVPRLQLQLALNEFRIPQHAVSYLVAFSEICLLSVLSYFCCYFCRSAANSAIDAAMLCYLAGIILLTVLDRLCGLHQPLPLKLKPRALSSALSATFAACIVYNLLVFFGAAEKAVAWTALWLLLVMAGEMVLWCFLAWFVNRFKTNLSRRVAVVGLGRQAEYIANQVNASDGALLELIGIFKSDAGRVPGATDTLSDLVAYSKLKSVDVIVIASNDPAEIQTICQRVRMIAADVLLASHVLDDAAPFRLPPHGGSLLLKQPLDDRQRFQKRCFDIVTSSVLLLVTLPPMLLIAFAIGCESRGPILFRQPRIGFNNRVFTILKFRTMQHEAADLLASRQTSRNDPRVTAVGRHLRRWSLDELPQLINVLRGDMSLVGPRPHAPHTRAAGHHLDAVVRNYADRHLVKPGLTGWAQVNGSRGEIRNIEDIERRVRLDFDYIARWSLLLDLRIIVLTLRSVMASGAY